MRVPVTPAVRAVPVEAEGPEAVVAPVALAAAVLVAEIVPTPVRLLSRSSR